MNQEQICQVTARDEKWVPAKERVKISTTNVRLETTVPQKEETSWYTVKKVKDTESYEFLLANKKCVVDVKENVDYPELIWKDFAFQIDYRQLKKGICENMPYPRIGEDFQEYGLPIPKTMLTEAIKQSESY
ncbi:hypothetical protein Tco_1176191 [Tanacetum coccineum]